MRAENIEAIIRKGKSTEEEVKQYVTLYLLEQDKATWNNDMQEEYDGVYPYWTNEYTEEFDSPTSLMLRLRDIQLSSVSYTINNELLTITTKEPIDYSEDENYVTLKEYINETRVISEAIEATYDEDGRVLTEAVAEATKLVRPYTPLDVTDTMVQNRLNTYPEYSEFLKKQKEEDKQQIVVEHNTVKYQGDPMSINFMSAVGAVGAMRMFQVLVQSGVITQEQYDSVYKTVETWKGADDVLHEVQIESVVDACELAMKAMAKIIGVK